MYVDRSIEREQAHVQNCLYNLTRLFYALLLFLLLLLLSHFFPYYEQVSGTSYFPILGAIAKLHPSEPWVAHQRRDYANGAGEVYVPVLSGETKPMGEAILANFER
jgi:hypothetical protein